MACILKGEDAEFIDPKDIRLPGDVAYLCCIPWISTSRDLYNYFHTPAKFVKKANFK